MQTEIEYKCFTLNVFLMGLKPQSYIQPWVSWNKTTELLYMDVFNSEKLTSYYPQRGSAPEQFRYDKGDASYEEQVRFENFAQTGVSFSGVPPIDSQL